MNMMTETPERLSDKLAHLVETLRAGEVVDLGAVRIIGLKRKKGKRRFAVVYPDGKFEVYTRTN